MSAHRYFVKLYVKRGWGYGKKKLLRILTVGFEFELDMYQLFGVQDRIAFLFLYRTTARLYTTLISIGTIDKTV